MVRGKRSAVDFTFGGFERRGVHHVWIPFEAAFHQIDGVHDARALALALRCAGPSQQHSVSATDNAALMSCVTITVVSSSSLWDLGVVMQRCCSPDKRCERALKPHGLRTLACSPPLSTVL